MRLMILGGGWSQISAIRRAKERGFQVLVADFNPQAPGCSLADQMSLASSFSPEDVITDARRFQPDGLLTLGTDQPVLTVALAAAELDLPCPINPETALAVTNKKVMKNLLSSRGIAVPEYRILPADFVEADLRDLPFPAVIKPLDSQGQRGVFLIETPEALRSLVPEVLRWSRQREFILERFYPSEEITVNGWVASGILHILTVVDRVTRMFPPHIGICTAHRYPSRHLADHGSEIAGISRDIVYAAGITEGPVYFQLLIGEDGLKVNEIACRLGGAYEDRYMAFETGVNTVDLLIDSSLGREIPPGVFSRVPYPGYNHVISVPLVFTRPGMSGENGPLGDILSVPGVIGGGYLLQPGTRVDKIENSTRRAAWAAVAGGTAEEVNTALDRLFHRLSIPDQRGQNMVIDTRKDAYV